MSVSWHGQARTVRIKSLRLGGGFSRRLGAPHVLALAKSKDEIGAINLPAVCWKLGKEKRLEVAAGEDRIAAELVRNGGKWDASIEVRAFDADDDQDIAKVRAHENAHRRHDDRDAWLRSLVARELEDSAQSDRGADEPGEEATSGEDPSEADGGDAQPGDASDSPAPVAQVDGEYWTQPVVYEPENPLSDFPEDRNNSLRSEPTKAGKAAARKKAAEAAGTTPAAVKQAEYRDRKKKGEVKAKREVHRDGASPLGEAALAVLDDLNSVADWIGQAQTRLAHMAKKHASLGVRFNLDGARSQLSECASLVRGMRPEVTCVYCLAKPDQDCNACKNDRWITKAQLANAPESLRKAAGLS